VTRISVVCLDMAGTTVRDSGTVMAAFTAALTAQPVADLDAAMTYVRDTMGQSKIEVFRHLLATEDQAQQANTAFEASYEAAVRAGDIEPMPGADSLFAACRDAGIRTCLSTGFSPATRDSIIDVLGWRDAVDLVLSPADAGRGRPWPDMPLAALTRLGGGSVHELAVAGDTVSDVESGLRAGAGITAGVLSGESTREELSGVPGRTGLPGTPLILDSVADLLHHLTR